MNAPASITVHSRRRPPRVWRRIGEREHETRDGRWVTLTEWASPCVVCDETFTITMPQTAVQGSASFGTIACRRHRGLTEPERRTLRRLHSRGKAGGRTPPAIAAPPTQVVTLEHVRRAAKALPAPAGDTSFLD